MVTSMGGKHLITLQEWTNEEIDTCLDTAYDLKLKFARKIPHASLRDETVFMMFFDESTRTRNSPRPAPPSLAPTPTSWMPARCRSSTAIPPRIRQ